LMHILAARVSRKFAKGVEKRQAFDIANRTADLDDAKVVALGGQKYTPLDFVVNVRNHLDGCAKVVAPPLLLNDGVVDLTGSAVIKTAGGVLNEPLVMAQVQIGFGTIVRNEHFTMLERRH